MSNLVAVVTGGTRGIGLGIAEALVGRKAFVAITYVQDDVAAEQTRQRLAGLAGDDRKVLILRGDAGDPGVAAEHHRAIVERFGAVTVLVNNAGIMPERSFDQLTVPEWDETIRINLNSAFYWSSLVVPGMKRVGFGRIINISSLAARGGGVVGPHYAASKAGMLGLTRYAAKELGPFGITVNAIAPAFIEDAGIFAKWTPEQKKVLKGKVFVDRIGTVADVVRAFEYLLDSSFVTGATLDVCGGSFMI